MPTRFKLATRRNSVDTFVYFKVDNKDVDTVKGYVWHAQQHGGQYTIYRRTGVTKDSPRVSLLDTLLGYSVGHSVRYKNGDTMDFCRNNLQVGYSEDVCLRGHPFVDYAQKNGNKLKSDGTFVYRCMKCKEILRLERLYAKLMKE